MKIKPYLILRIIISFSLLALLIWIMRDRFYQIGTILKSTNIYLALCGFFIYCLSVVIMGVRLVKILSVQGINLSYREGIYLCYIGYFFNNFFPTSIGGDVVKAYYAGKKFNKKSAAFSGVVMDRLLAMIPFTLIPSCALLFIYNDIENKGIVYFVVCLFFITTSLTAILLNRRLAAPFIFLLRPIKHTKWGMRIKRVYDSMNIYRLHKIILGWSFGLSVLGQALFVISVYVLARSLGVNFVPVGVFFLLIPIVGIIGMAPSINGLGIREAGLVYMFKSYIPTEVGFSLSLLVLAALIGLSIIGWFIFVLKKDIYRFKPDEIKDLEGELE